MFVSNNVSAGAGVLRLEVDDEEMRLGGEQRIGLALDAVDTWNEWTCDFLLASPLPASSWDFSLAALPLSDCCYFFSSPFPFSSLRRCSGGRWPAPKGNGHASNLKSPILGLGYIAIFSRLASKSLAKPPTGLSGSHVEDTISILECRKWIAHG